MTALKAVLWDIIIVFSKVVLEEKLQKRTESSKEVVLVNLLR